MQRLASLGAVTVLAWLSMTATTNAQSPLFSPRQTEVQPATVGSPAWGLGSDIFYVLVAHDFDRYQGSDTTDANTGAKSCDTAVCSYLAGLRLPSGASIRGFELSACDGHDFKAISFVLGALPRTPGMATLLAPLQSTGQIAVPGCTTFSFDLPTPVTVDNSANAYVAAVNSPFGVEMQWTTLRVKYRLQVSPAPGTASFNDVPLGHPQRQFIEALSASGITGGCGGGNYCPDQPVTRGQMAVFLAAALGLHFPN